MQELLIPKPALKRRAAIERPIGVCYNLEQIYHQLNQEYFEDKLKLKITWSGTGKLPKSSILFGSYHSDRKLIRVNRLLDHPSFPPFFVRFIIYHEMLHEIYPPKRGKRGRWQIHHAAFKVKEREFKEFSQVETFLTAWKKEHLKHHLATKIRS